MAQTLQLTRNQFAAFLNDHESIKQFEKLFAIGDSIAPDFVNEVYTLAGIADSKAVQAIDAIERLSQAIELVALAPEKTQEMKNQEVLAWLSMQ